MCWISFKLKGNSVFPICEGKFQEVFMKYFIQFWLLLAILRLSHSTAPHM